MSILMDNSPHVELLVELLHLMCCHCSHNRRSMEAYVSLCLNLLCLSIYLLDIVLNIIFLSWRVFWTYEERSWNRFQFIFLCCFTIDWILLLAQVTSRNRRVSTILLLNHTPLALCMHLPQPHQIVQPFRCLRLAMVVCKAKNVGHITNVSNLSPDY